MAEIHPFRAFRYDLARVGPLSDVIAPPYDVIDPALQDVLYQRSPHNVVRLILNKESASDTADSNRYTRAAQTLKEWQGDGVLVQDSARSLYVYHQDFEVEGKRYTRKGFMARVRLERFGEGRIYPHEQTMSGPKEDRLRLTRATSMNLSQIFGLFPDEKGEVQKQLDLAVGRALPLEATDHLGVVSRLWPISDQHVTSAVMGMMGPKPIFIADGHHRYETALRYLDERRQSGDVSGPDAPANFVLMMLVSMQDPGLVILPTHRLVSGIGDIDSAGLHARLDAHFEIDSIGQGEAGARETWEMIEADGSQSVLGFGTVADQTWHLARLKKPEVMTNLAGDHSAAWRGLGVSILHVLVLDHLLSPGGRGQGEGVQCRYVHLLRETTAAAAERSCQLAVLVPPARMKHVEEIAGNLEKMPPKSTYFYPKLLSGLVFNSLKGN